MVIYLKNFILSVIVGPYIAYAHDFHNFITVWSIQTCGSEILCHMWPVCLQSLCSPNVEVSLQGIWILFVHLIRSTRLKHRPLWLKNKIVPFLLHKAIRAVC